VTPLSRVLGLVLLLSMNAHAAEHDWPAAPRAKDTQERVSLSLSNRAGLVKAPFVTTAFPEVSGFATVMTGTAAVRFSSIGWLRLSLPISFVRLDFPARAQVSETALGNLELGLEHRLELRRSTRLGLLAAFLVPSAEHGPKTALLGNRALALGSALSGGKSSPLLTPGVTGLRLGASVEHALRPFELRASLDVPVLVRFSDASLPEDAETHAIALLPVVDLRAGWWITSWFGASLGAGLITEPQRVQEPILERDRNRRLQPVVEPGLHLRLGQHVALGLEASVPVGGTLGGDAWSIGPYGRWGL
jgi:hypothetical protein